MRKTLPIIVVLITLSLLGLIVLQISWLNNLVQVQGRQLFTKIDEIGSQVRDDLSLSKRTRPTIKLPKRFQSFSFGNSDLSKLIKSPSIEEKFTTKEVQDKIRGALDVAGLRFINFEFAITSTSDDFEMMSPNFSLYYPNDKNIRKFYFNIVPESENDADGPYENLIIVVQDFNKEVWNSLIWVITGGAIFMLIIIAAFYITLRTILNQKKLSEIKSDFINNMTHEFKTPLATISLAIDSLRNERVSSDKEKMQYFFGIIKDENIRMNKHVETILKAALMEKRELNLQMDKLSVHSVIKRVLENYGLQLEERGGKIETDFKADYDIIMADDVHFTNVISNLIDNAIKYSKDNLVITITTYTNDKSFFIKIKDNGIGMSKETVRKVFEKFYRAHTGNLHNVKGFGLGMSYVKTIIDAHKGKISVESTLGEGSTFTVEMPRESF